MIQATIPHSRPLPRARYRPTLADDCALFRPDPAGWDDPDREQFTWGEAIDQSRIGEPGSGRFANDDVEMDDGV